MNGFALKEKILEVKNNACFVDHFTTHKMLQIKGQCFSILCANFFGKYWQVKVSIPAPKVRSQI